ncbi:hypothetical protein GF373_00210 [bacterium]|nr:hypothetical protein [bacterium]
MAETRITSIAEDHELNSAFKKVETLLSSRKARDCLKKAEDTLAFDTEIFLEPIRDDLAECMEVVGDLIRERGTLSSEIQELIPILTKWLDPGHEFSREIARLERTIAEKKRSHPDFIYAAKLNTLIRQYEGIINEPTTDSITYGQVLKKLESAKVTLQDHMQKKIRIAQKAFAPDMLELAQAQLELAQHQGKVLEMKSELLNAAQNQTRETLSQLAKIFEDADPELANAILAQTSSFVSAGNATQVPNQKKMPTSLDEFKKELEQQKGKLDQLETQHKECRGQLKKLKEFEDAIFETYGEKLRTKGLQFKKQLKVEKSGMGSGQPTPKKGVRMARQER